MATTTVKQLDKESRDRLKKLVPMLASVQPGEVVAAVAAIGRTLEHHGNDFHDLAALLTKEPKAPTPKPTPDRRDSIIVGLYREKGALKIEIEKLKVKLKESKERESQKINFSPNFGFFWCLFFFILYLWK